MLKFLAGLAFRKSVDSIVASVRLAIEQLDELVDSKIQEISGIDDVICELKNERSHAAAERDRARSVSLKMKALINA